MFNFQRMEKETDNESGQPGALYPGMMESVDLRWAFIRKIYTILTVQLALTAAVAAVVVTVKPIPHFFVSSNGGLALYIVLLLLPFLIMCPLYYYHQKHPINFVLLGFFTVSMSFAVGMSCAFTSVLLALYFLKDRHPLNIFLLLLFTMCTSIVIGLVCLFANGRLVLQAAGVTVVIFLSLTLYTFWAAKRGHDFNFLGPFLFAAIITLIIFGIIQIIFPLGKTVSTVIAGISVLVFCGFIIYDTDNIIKRFNYDDYIIASVELYLDVINLFLNLLTIFTNLD